MRYRRTDPLSAVKIQGLAAAKASVSRLREAGKRVVFTNGCFDLLHYGHVKYLEHARTLGDALVVAVNTDASIRRIKGRGRPVVGQADRARLVAALSSTDIVVLFGEDTPFKVIRALKPDVLVKGADWQPAMIVGADIVRRRGGKVRTIRLVPGRSTTQLIEKIAKRFGKSACR